MAVLTLQPTPQIQFRALASSLGFTEEEGRYYATKRPLTEREVAKIRDRLEWSYHWLIQVECQGVA